MTDVTKTSLVYSIGHRVLPAGDTSSAVVPWLRQTNPSLSLNRGDRRPIATTAEACMQIPVSVGEVVDKITILTIKERKISSEAKRANVRRELTALRETWDREGLAWPSEQADALVEVNEALWDVEDVLRRHEAAADFGAPFVELARSVYQLNDRRARLKRQINEQLGSELVEEKDYVAY